VAITMDLTLRMSYEPGATINLKPVPGDDSFAWRWQALPFTEVDDPHTFVLPLLWRSGEPVGLLRVSRGPFTMMAEPVLALLHCLALVLRDLVSGVEAISPGEVPPLYSPRRVMMAYEAKRLTTPAILAEGVRAQLAYFQHGKIFSELRAMDERAIHDEAFGLVRGAFVLMGYKPKDVAKWAQIRFFLRYPRKLWEHMRELPLEIAETEEVRAQEKARWDTFRLVTHRVDFNTIEKHASAPVRMLMRWVRAAKLTHNLALTIEREHKPSEPSAVANVIFDQVDTNQDGFIDVVELVNYLLREYSHEVAHRMVRVLDTDHDGQIDRDEWNRGFNSGMMAEVIERFKRERDQGNERAKRLEGRRGAALGMTVGVAAAQFESEKPVKQHTSKADGGKKGVQTGSSAKPPKASKRDRASKPSGAA